MCSQQANAADNAIVVQILDSTGCSVVVGNRPYLRLRRHDQLPLGFDPETNTEPINWLLPGMRAVDFLGRSAELEAYAAFLENAPPISLGIIHGDGGAGKTRFGLELCETADAMDWRAGFVDQGEPERFFAEQDLAQSFWAEPTLLVFDYALSIASGLNTWLKDLCYNKGDTAKPLHILLLERHVDENLQTGWVKEVFRGLYTTTVKKLLPRPPQRLLPLGEMSLRREIMQGMLKRLNSSCQLPEPGQSLTFDTQLQNVEWAGQPLYLMLAAMTLHATGRDADADAVLSLQRQDLAEEVADHEYKRLFRLLPDTPDGRNLLAHLAAFVTLCQGLPQATLLDVIAGEMQELGHSTPEPAALERLLCSALPLEPRPSLEGGATEKRLAPIQPDVVGQAFVVKYLGKGDDSKALGAVRRAYGRAGQPVAQTLVRCIRDFQPRGEYIHTPLSGAAETAMRWLRALVHSPDLTLPDQMNIAISMPTGSTIFCGLKQKLASSILARLSTGDGAASPPLLKAMALHNAAVDLAVAGNCEQALPPAREAVDIYRQLAQSMPDAHLPYLAMSLNTLATRLSGTGKKAEALASAHEAVGIWRRLAQDMPDAYLPNLAMSLNNLATFLSEIGQKVEALAPAQEAVEIYRRLTQTMPETYLPDLAMSLNNLSSRLSEIGQKAEAQALAQEAVDIYYKLAQAMPDAYLPGLALSLNILANRLGETGKKAEALGFAQEAVDIRRRLADSMPEAYLPDLAISLNNLATFLSEIGQKAEALPPAQEAVAIRRRLAQAMPEAYLPNLAGSLSNLAYMLGETGRRAEALPPAQEAVAIYRTLAQAMPEAYLPNLARSLNNLSSRRSEIGQKAEALPPAQEAVAIYRKLADSMPETYLPGLGLSLNILANRLGEIGQKAEALPPTHEAVDIYRPLAQAMPEAYLPNLAMSLNNQAIRLSEIGKKAEALTLARESARIYLDYYRQLPEAYARPHFVSMATYISIHDDITFEDAQLLFQQDPEAQVRALLEDSQQTTGE